MIGFLRRLACVFLPHDWKSVPAPTCESGVALWCARCGLVVVDGKTMRPPCPTGRWRLVEVGRCGCGQEGTA